LILDEIVSIRKIGIRKTVDIEVDGDHLFYCNGILTHNSASGDTNDISEENIQGGISKVQAADNILAFIPNSQSRELGIMRAKFLKTRDSGGVGQSVYFRQEWQTLSFVPHIPEDGAVELKTLQSSGSANLPSQKSEFKLTQKKPTVVKDENRPTAVVKANDEKPTAVVKADDATDGNGQKTRSIIKGLSGRNKPRPTNAKLC